MHFSAAIMSAFRRMGDFGGRSSRGEYWYFFLLNFMVLISTVALARAGVHPVFDLATLAWSFIAFVPGLSLFIRRLRDAGYSPWMSLFVLAGPLGAVVFLVLLCQPSSGGPTRAHIGSATVLESKSTWDYPDPEGARRTSAGLLGLCLIATLAIVLGSVTYAASQASLAEAEAAASANRAAAAASSRAAAAASASASASASRQAAAAAEAKRIEVLAQNQRDAEARRAMEASKAAAAAAEAYAAARDELVAKGWFEGPEEIFYQWIPIEQLTCELYQRCSQLKVTALNGCPNGVSVEASAISKETVIGSLSGYSPGFLQGQNALVTLTIYDEKADNVSVKKMTCR